MLTMVRAGQGEAEILQPGTAIPPDATWLDLRKPGADEMKAVEAIIGTELPTEDEMAEVEPSSRLFREPAGYFLTCTVLSGSVTDHPANVPVTFMLAPDRLVTLRHADVEPFRTYRQRLRREPELCREPVTTLFNILDAIVDRAADTLELVQRDIDETSATIFRRDDMPGGGGMASRQLADVLRKIGRDNDLLIKLRDSLNSLQRLLSYASLMPQVAEHQHIREMVKVLTRDTQSLLEQAGSIAGNAGFLLDAALGLVNIEQSQIIKIFSVVAFVFLPPTMIASIYGMNFERMPELHWHYGYLFAVCMMILSAVLPYLFFKRKNWL